MPKTKWGILGPGRIAQSFAKDLAKLDDAELYAVGSRAQERARDFADEYRAQHAYGSYEELAQDPEVEIIYVATPHPFHMENTILCLEQGKAVLCEKPMAINARQVRRMVDAARENNVFLMEAMWTRFNPVTKEVQAWIDEERIGEVRMLTVDFGFRSAWNPQGRLLNPELGGGALLDVGVYVTAYAHMVFGRPPLKVCAAAHVGETGVDEQTGMLLEWDEGELGLLSCAIRTATPQSARIDGTEGTIFVPDFWHATHAELRIKGQEPEVVEGERGYHFEAAEAMECLRTGKKESAGMPLSESIAIAETLDEARRQVGIRYPMESEE